MTNRPIPCPECRGLTLEVPEYACRLCGKDGTIPDRRAPSAAERTVERIKAFCTPQSIAKPWGPFEEGQDDVAWRVLNIINEEAANGSGLHR